jgi:hypothetical protein
LHHLRRTPEAFNGGRRRARIRQPGRAPGINQRHGSGDVYLRKIGLARGEASIRPAQAPLDRRTTARTRLGPQAGFGLRVRMPTETPRKQVVDGRQCLCYHVSANVYMPVRLPGGCGDPHWPSSPAFVVCLPGLVGMTGARPTRSGMPFRGAHLMLALSPGPFGNFARCPAPDDGRSIQSPIPDRALPDNQAHDRGRMFSVRCELEA